jgi:hypothetical protein
LWDKTDLTTSHESALTLLFLELERSASEQPEVLLGTPGSLAERTNETGTHFWVHRYSDALNRRQEIYVGKVDDPKIERRISSLREMIATANATITRVRLLARAGFATIDRKAYFTLASLHNHGLFRAGALLVGSHAYGALLNALGVRAALFATEDVDIVRREALASRAAYSIAHRAERCCPVREEFPHQSGAPRISPRNQQFASTGMVGSTLVYAMIGLQ